MICRHIPPLPNSIRYLWPYEGLVRELILSMKYRPSRRLAQFLAEQLAIHASGLFEEHHWDLVIPVPSSRESMQQRGFNQCVMLADHLKQVWLHRKLTYRELLVVKHRGYRTRQSALPPEQRLTNVKRVFQVRSSSLTESRILLVDDVITTGATIAAATEQLLLAGASTIDVVALARANTWSSFRYKVWRQFHAERSQPKETPREA